MTRLNRPLRLCTVPGCPNRANGRCPKHRAGRTADKFADVYSSRAWKALSRQVRAESPVCQWPGCSRPSEQADHIVAMHDGGAPLSRLNVQALCGWHHAKKGKADRRRRKAAESRAESPA